MLSEQGGSIRLVRRWFSIDEPADVKDLQIALIAGEVHVAVIASPNETHVGYLSFLLGRVPQIIVEKPLAENELDADLAVALSEGTPSSRCMGLDHYVAKPAIHYVSSFARSGELAERIGQIQHIEFSMMEARALDPSRTNTLDRGLTFDMAIHGYAILLSLMNLNGTSGILISEARAARYSLSPIRGETAARIDTRLPGDATATIVIGKGLYDKKTLTIRGTKGVVEADVSTGLVELLVDSRRETLQSISQDDAYDVVLEEAILEASGVPGSKSQNLVDLALARDALKLVIEVRERYAAFEPYTVGTVPSALGVQRCYKGAGVEIYLDRSSLDRAVMREILTAADASIDRYGSFIIVIPGGTSFLGVSLLLLEKAFEAVDLSKWLVFFTDEHSSPHDGPNNNYYIAFEQGGWRELVSGGRIPLDSLYRIKTEMSSTVLNADDLAQQLDLYQTNFQTALAKRSGPDIVVLGLGVDRHTSSLLPLHEESTSTLVTSDNAYEVVEYTSQIAGEDRVRASLTASGIRSASKLLMVAFGSKKSAAIRDVLTSEINLITRPGTILQEVKGTLMTDEAGASELPAA